LYTQNKDFDKIFKNLTTYKYKNNFVGLLKLCKTLVSGMSKLFTALLEFPTQLYNNIIIYVFIFLYKLYFVIIE